LARSLRNRPSAAYGLLLMARLDAVRGARADFGRRIAEAMEFSDLTEFRSLGMFLETIHGLECLANGACDDAVVHLDLVLKVNIDFGVGNPASVPFVGDLVEAHVRAGNPAAARDALGWLEERVDAGSPPWQIAVRARCRALVTDDPDEADAAYRAAAAEDAAYPYEHARTLLCHGVALRRSRHKTRSRAPLLAAHRLFSTLGAAPWTQRCAAELAASGRRLPDERPRAGLERLTPQELQVARMAATGLNNNEIGTALFISPKTVEAHLTHVYRKLGLRSRSDIARLVTASGLLD
jgi:DNA-binding CsgD family transcriptional regulator